MQSSSNESGRAVQQVLGVDWDVETDQLLFDVSDIACVMKDSAGPYNLLKGFYNYTPRVCMTCKMDNTTTSIRYS